MAPEAGFQPPPSEPDVHLALHPALQRVVQIRASQVASRLPEQAPFPWAFPLRVVHPRRVGSLTQGTTPDPSLLSWRSDGIVTRRSGASWLCSSPSLSRNLRGVPYLPGSFFANGIFPPPAYTQA